MHRFCRCYCGIAAVFKGTWDRSLVRKTLSCRISHREASDNSQLLGMWIENFLLWNFYAPPTYGMTDRGNAQVELCEMCISAMEGLHLEPSCPWVAVGDANEVPGDSLIEDCFRTYGAHVLAQSSSTRWESSREIDWFSTNHRHALSQPCSSDLHFSDHKLIWATFEVSPRDNSVGVLRSTPNWSKPSCMDTADWRTLLENSWELCKPQQDLVFLPVQEDWDTFNKAVDRMLRTAVRQVAAQQEDDFVRQEFLKRANTKLRKGVLGKWTARSTVLN